VCDRAVKDIMNITLIGMPGVGKSILGSQIAKSLQFRFIDTDLIIEKKAKMALQQIIDLYGEEVFLDLEEKTVLDLGLHDKCVFCPGGSIIYSEQAMLFLKKQSRIVLLDKEPVDIEKQILDVGSRGIIGFKAMNFQDLYIQRMPLYNKYADIRVNLSGISDILVQSKMIIEAIF
jgi:shikimate kinase